MQRDHIGKHRHAGRAAQPFFLVALVALGAGGSLAASAQSPAARAFRPVTDAMLKDPPPADWLSFRRTLNAWGYSPLADVNGGNAHRQAGVGSEDHWAGQYVERADHHERQGQ
jgi:hypothetical protein